jgi:hypothetical protein
VAPGLDAPVGYRVQRSRRLADPGGYTRTDPRRSRCGFWQPAQPCCGDAASADDGPDGAADALWSQHFCTKQRLAHVPWGRSRPHDLIRIVDAVAHEVICAAETDDCAPTAAADHPVESVKNFVFADAAGQLARISLPTRLRRRQRVLAKVAHVLRRPPDTRTFHASWSVASVYRLALMHDWPYRAHSWVPKGSRAGSAGGLAANGIQHLAGDTSRLTRPSLHRSSERARLPRDVGVDAVEFAEYSFGPRP